MLFAVHFGRVVGCSEWMSVSRILRMSASPWDMVIRHATLPVSIILLLPIVHSVCVVSFLGTHAAARRLIAAMLHDCKQLNSS